MHYFVCILESQILNKQLVHPSNCTEDKVYDGKRVILYRLPKRAIDGNYVGKRINQEGI
jgi:hypothetical protein